MDAQPSARWSPSFVSDEWHKTELAELQKFIETTATAAPQRGWASTFRL